VDGMFMLHCDGVGEAIHTGLAGSAGSLAAGWFSKGGGRGGLCDDRRRRMRRECLINLDQHFLHPNR